MGGTKLQAVEGKVMANTNILAGAVGFGAAMAVFLVLLEISGAVDRSVFAYELADMVCPEGHRFEDDRLYCQVDDDWIAWKPE